VTQATTARLLLSDLQNASGRLARTQQMISSGKALSVPSDDPFATSRALTLRSDLDENRQYQRNVEEASSWQSVTDTALGQMGDYTLRARDLLLQGSSDTTS